jgi:fructose-1,6-bisphosphatase I
VTNHNNKYVVLLWIRWTAVNIDVNVSVGTIFLRFIDELLNKTSYREFFCSQGINQVAAGYGIYGTSTMLVYTTDTGEWLH